MKWISLLHQAAPARPVAAGVWLGGWLLALLGSSSAAVGQPSRLPKFAEHYRLVFSDDFRYPSVDSMLSPHLKKWAHGYAWGNAHTDTTERCDNRNKNYAYLREDIRLVPNPADAADQCLALDFNYHAEPLRNVVSANGTVSPGPFYKTTGLVRALYRADSLCADEGFQYGIFEIRARMPSVQGLQAAFWLWAGAGDACGRQPAGWLGTDSWEIDVFETYTLDDGVRKFFGTLHPNPFRQHKGTQGFYEFQRPSVPADDFHLYTLVWTPNLLEWYFDGKLYKRVRNRRGSPANPGGIPQTELNLLLSSHYIWDCLKNNHCDTLADGSPNNRPCTSPQDPFLIDYVRIYKPVVPPAGGAWPLVEKRYRRKAPAASTAAVTAP
ncbi:family 16 glycosylhydrolase [Hymenobacter sp. 15J16-1T3B]|uniref:glycoside hydrolase family 16 protein n=1 Tax=Hymenobacter sp. 15J16-1T3B TaxID=2886941 RepID=UPI001D11A17B|nr:family 16 glycosylhydrolase [Hymenobacter sp. 15J16-1T3B]MCC3157677.1 family 16 glycosylhydrolase [Hymenobacter sp. 15J16-1T3B]